jgi:hypothetical protein
VAGQNLEVTVVVQDGRPFADGNGRDQTVDQLPHRFTPAATATIELGSPLEVRHSPQAQQREREQSLAETIAIAVDVFLLGGRPFSLQVKIVNSLQPPSHPLLDECAAFLAAR